MVSLRFRVFIVALLPFAIILACFAFFQVTLPSNVVITNDEFSSTRPLQTHYLVTQRTNTEAVVGDDEARFISVKLFGFIPVKRVKVDILPFEEVIAGGRLLGLYAQVDNEKGFVTGLGTLTYVNPENLNFAALGHKMNDYETGKSVDVLGGKIYKNSVVGIEKSAGKKVGIYKSSLRGESEAEGEIHTSNAFGVYGCLRSDSDLAKGEAVGLVSRWGVTPGRAKLRTTLEGEVRDFDIEIIKTRFQKKPSNKSMIIRVVDKELLAKTGGIIHGMSGSPIIQNGKVVGALTHVVLGDASKGYGIYIDFVVA